MFKWCLELLFIRWTKEIAALKAISWLLFSKYLKEGLKILENSLEIGKSITAEVIFLKFFKFFEVDKVSGVGEAILYLASSGFELRGTIF